MVNVAINGFGRIGRLFFRLGYKELNIVAINDLGDVNTAAHLLKYDSVHGKFEGKVEVRNNCLIVDGREIKFFSEKEPAKLPWRDLKIDIVAECTGKFRKREEAEQHIKAGAKKVLISAPAKGDAPVKSIVLGVNENEINKDETILDCASCTTNCLMPVVKVLNDKFKIKRAFMTTVHAYTNDQVILDVNHKDIRRARAAAINIIPTSTGASKAAAKVIPELKGKVDGIAIRVPVADGSLVDLVAELEKNASVEEINKAMKEAAERELKGILEYSEDPLVSSDIIGNLHSSVFDAQSTMVLGGNLVKVLAWYDNEAAYARRMVELIKKWIS
ncbi:MAG: type I glyceraldehyde-3-phosphate dehydrogenase [Candidatus Diapherotrites archaeon]|nr:type I glyceraldehyde-3-phosphate dehydrogenase [Candidatus Diapherotrites archaeon]